MKNGTHRATVRETLAPNGFLSDRPAGGLNLRLPAQNIWEANGEVPRGFVYVSLFLRSFGFDRNTEKGRNDLVARSHHFCCDLLQRLKFQIPGFGVLLEVAEGSFLLIVINHRHVGCIRVAWINDKTEVSVVPLPKSLAPDFLLCQFTCTEVNASELAPDVEKDVCANLLLWNAPIAWLEDVESARKPFVIGSLEFLSLEVICYHLDGISFLVGECSVLGSRKLVCLSGFVSRLFHNHETDRPCHSPSNIKDVTISSVPTTKCLPGFPDVLH